jgi:DNA-binding transcriptional LysR family regulator
MESVESMRVFQRVAERAGFAEAARDLRTSAAAVTRQIAALEESLGVRLFDRGQPAGKGGKERGKKGPLGLTQAGRAYLEHCKGVLPGGAETEAAPVAPAPAPQGLLRVTAPVDFGQTLVSSVLVDFLEAHPELTIDLNLSNRSLDLDDAGIDVAVRVVMELEGQFVAHPVAQSRLAVWGSPAYLEKHGHPRGPEDLVRHRNLVFVAARPLDEWSFTRGNKQLRVKLPAVMTSNIAEPLRLAALRGAGLMICPSFMSPLTDLQAGLLQPVLADWTLPTLGVYALCTHRRFLMPNVRVFVEALRAAFGDGSRDPWWPVAPAASPPASAWRAPSRRARKANAAPAR